MRIYVQFKLKLALKQCLYNIFLTLFYCFIDCINMFYTIIMFGNQEYGISVVFFVVSRSREGNLRHVLDALHCNVQTLHETRNPSSIIFDNALYAKINTLRYVPLYYALCDMHLVLCIPCSTTCVMQPALCTTYHTNSIAILLKHLLWGCYEYSIARFLYACVSSSKPQLFTPSYFQFTAIQNCLKINYLSNLSSL